MSAAFQSSNSQSSPSVESDVNEPPGGILVWLIVFLEILTFGAGLGVFLYQSGKNEAVFEASRNSLNQPLALVNTVILLTGGWCMANGMVALRRGTIHSARKWIAAAIGSGIGFLLIKSVEYSAKIQHGIGFGDDVFFTLYYALTGFHSLHVLAAVVILLYLWRGIGRERYTRDDHFDVESGGIFWHMCDLIWLLIYPVIYLL